MTTYLKRLKLKAIRKGLPQRREIGRVIDSNILIAAGGFSRVTRGLLNDQGHTEDVAMKWSNRVENLRNEMNILQSLEHKLIIRPLEFLAFEEQACMVLPYTIYGSVSEYMNGATYMTGPTRFRSMKTKETRMVLLQVAAALTYMLDKKSMIHRDIKLENFLVVRVDDENDIQRILLADFDTATEWKGELLVKPCGTQLYAAPEMFDRRRWIAHGPSADVWSLGVAAFVMATRRKPFTTVDDICTGTYSIPRTVDADLSNLLTRMLTVDPSKRIDLQGIDDWAIETDPDARWRDVDTDEDENG